jgi:hypothetical protein
MNLLSQAKSKQLIEKQSYFLTIDFIQDPKNNSPMKELAQHKLTSIISFLIVVCLSFSPVANSTMLSISTDSAESYASVDVEHQCHHEAKDSTSSISINAQNSNCEHGPSCSLLCSIAVELSAVDTVTLAQEKIITWSAMGFLDLKLSFLSRLDKPPKA